MAPGLMIPRRLTRPACTQDDRSGFSDALVDQATHGKIGTTNIMVSVGSHADTNHDIPYVELPEA